MQTGIKIVDSLIPIGLDRGSLLLVIGKLVKLQLRLILLLIKGLMVTYFVYM